jgi:hypothetical protein
MRDDEAPPRLSLSGSPELRTALRGMAERSPETERVARMARNVAAVTGVRPELLMPTLSDSAGAPPHVTLEPAQTHALTSTFGAAAKIVAAGTVVAVTGLLGYWAGTGDDFERRVPARLAAAPALASLHATPPAKTARQAAHNTPPVRQRDAPRVLPSRPPQAAAVESRPSEQQPAREKRSLHRARPALEAPTRISPPRSAPTASASAAVRSSHADQHDRARSVPAPAPAEHGKAAAADELGLLHLAQSALRTSPAQALHLVAQHRREFPRSALAQERDLIHVSALVRLGRTAEARRQAERFRRAYPRSAYGKQLDALAPEH